MTAPSEMPIDFRPWTQEALMSECWARDFDYEADVLRVAALFRLEAPTREQYEEHCRKEGEKMEDFFALNTRYYYEDGCACIHVDGSVKLQGPDVPNKVAAEYYQATCTCSRRLEPGDWQ